MEDMKEISFLFEKLRVEPRNDVEISSSEAANAYVKTVKEALKDDQNAFPIFVYVLRCFAGNEISLAEMHNEVYHLFQNYQGLMTDLHILESELNRPIAVRTDCFMPSIDDALSFIHCVKYILGCQEKYDIFLRRLIKNHKERFSRDTFVIFAKNLFEPYPLLWIRFTFFLPQQYDGKLKI
ncbi:hypothetical protein ZOSMA_67G00280 [Zostera marina]|uniref:Uncharacterized protein n=1 Tax=Zostera marina TaxID=29655 RepID=A0A0K9NUA4_ZOSMR|nr:hypothetical protein ZOSMA_67G00280 [Zostera marina]